MYDEEPGARLIRKQREEIERLESCVDQQLDVNEMLADKIKDQEEEIERLRAALAKSCEEGRDEMYDCGYNRLRAALERIANSGGYADELIREIVSIGGP
jgi:phage host-nuclease inhibitor protein Gam